MPGQPYSLRGVREACAVWPGQVRIYQSGSTDIVYCPIAKSESRWVKRFGSGNPALFGYEADEYWVAGHFTGGTSYGHNNDGTRTHTPSGAGSAGLSNLPGYSAGYIKRSAVKNPSSFLIFGDSLLDNFWDAFIDFRVPREELARRHNNGANVVYHDGHAKRVDPSDYTLPTGGDPVILREWNNDNLYP